MTDITPAKTKAVGRAWGALLDITERMSASATPRLYDALLHERKTRRNITVARALIVVSFTDGYADCEKPFHTFAGLSDGLLSAAALGATASRDQVALPAQWHGLAHACKLDGSGEA